MNNGIKLTAEEINMLLTRPVAEQYMTFVIRYNKQINEKKFISAVNAVASGIPHLKSIVKRVKNKFYFQFAGNKSFIFNLVHSGDVDGEIEKFVSILPDPFNDLPISILLIRNSSDTVCFKLDHVSADGAGLKLLFSLVAQFYNTGKISTVINTNRDLKQVSNQFSFIKKLKLIRSAVPPRPGFLPSVKDISLNDRYFVKRTVGPDEFAIMKQACKANSITINDLMLTSFWLAVFDVYSIPFENPYLFMVPIDLRKYMPEEKKDIIGNFSSGEFIPFEKKLNETMRDSAQRVSSLMKNVKENLPGIRLMLLHRLSLLQGVKKAEKTYNMVASYRSGFNVLTNIGVIENEMISLAGTEPEEAYIIGPVQYPRGLVISATSFNNTLTLTCGSSSRDNFKSYVDKIMDKTIERITGYN